MPLFLAQVTSSDDPVYLPLVFPLLFSAIALGMFLAATNREKATLKTPWKWFCLVPAGIALYFGITYVSNYADPFYREIATGKKMQMAHYGALIIPVLALIGIGVWEYLSREEKRRNA